MAATTHQIAVKYYTEAGLSQKDDKRREGPAKLVDIYASIPSMTRGKPVLIGGDPKGNNITYCCGNSVVIRNVKEPLIADTYAEHQKNPTVARYSPSGYYIASGDESGIVRVWDTIGAEHGLKLETRPISGKIYDIAWTEDSRRIVAVGEGREKFGHAFFADSGASVGEISGHSKTITSCDVKQTRPFRVMTGSEDNGTCWFEGPPFKWKKTLSKHSRFVNCIRFNPSGSHVISVSQDKSAWLYDGKSGEPIAALDSEHKGGIYCASWNKDGTKVLTASADRTCKIWDIETKKAVTTFQFSSEVEYQQLGCLWQNEWLLSIGLNGYLNYLDESSGKVEKTAYGHQNFVTALAYHKPSDSLFSGSYDSVQVRWNRTDASTELFEGTPHSNQISQYSLDGDSLYSASMDDSYGVVSVTDGKTGSTIATDSPARGISAVNGVAVGVSMKSVTLIKGNKNVAKVTTDFEPNCVAINADATLAAVGGKDNHVHLFKINGDALEADEVLKKHSREITALAFSPDGKYLASACANRSIICWKTDGWGRQVDGQWCFHKSGIKSLEWSPNSKLLASASLDQCIYIWAPEKKMRRLLIDLAHRGGVNIVTWIDEKTVATAGQDSCLRTYEVEFPF